MKWTEIDNNIWECDVTHAVQMQVENWESDDYEPWWFGEITVYGQLHYTDPNHYQTPQDAQEAIERYLLNNIEFNAYR